VEAIITHAMNVVADAIRMFLLAIICTGCALTSDHIQQATSAQSRAVVFDIDGTLTSGIHAIRTARDGAAEAVQAFADAGCRIIYLSARTPLFQWHIIGWLELNGFPNGSIHVTESQADRQDHQAFKQRVLEAYKVNGWTFVAAYGDSSTDFEAYAAAGIPVERVFALKREGEKQCQPGPSAGCYATWPEQMAGISRLVTPTD